MKINPEEANLISVFIRKLRPGKTYDDFRKAWYPDKGFGFPVRVFNCVSRNNDMEILSVGFMKLPEDQIEKTMKRISQSESIRHGRIDQVIESTLLRGIYKVVDDDDLS